MTFNPEKFATINRQPVERTRKHVAETRPPISEAESALAADAEQIAKIHKEIQRPTREAANPEFPDPRARLLGGFETDMSVDGNIQLKEPVKKALEQSAAKFRGEARYMTSVTQGIRIAAEYDIRTNNFSTQTRIDTLPDGRKVFMVYDHRGSWMHRALDTTMKWANGLRMRKATKKAWKAWFEEKSSIPVIANDDPNTVIMPFIPNVNAYDVFVHDKEIHNFGECVWAEHLTPEDKLDLASRVMDEVRRLHGKGVAWGEAILPNIIFTKEKQPIVCDPEVRYDDGMPLKEAMARDLRDLCFSIGSALANSEDMEPAAVVQFLLDRYGDREVIIDLQDLAHKKDSFLQRLAKPYELVRSGAGTRERYETILAAIRDYDIDRLLNKVRQNDQK